MPKLSSNKSEQLTKMLVAVDLVILTVRNARLCALLIQRGISPFKGQWALPGGFVLPSENLEQAALRELSEETGTSAGSIGHLEQLATFGDVKRDPRERVISVAYLALVPNLPVPKAGSDAINASLIAVADIQTENLTLAFDHRSILLSGVERAKAKLEYTPLATRFCSKYFAINELRQTYETVWQTKLDPANFHRKVTKADGFLQASEDAVQGSSGRPAQLFSQGPAAHLHPPILRPSGS
jgi:8-oxo-dGTP diphosphatase